MSDFSDHGERPGYADRKDAALTLLEHLERYRDANAVILAVPRGGVPVGYYLARALNLPLELLMTKKIGHPHYPEFAIGAVSPEDHILDPHVSVSQAYVADEVKRIRAELREKYRRFMGDYSLAGLAGKTVIVTDDGAATGNTLLSAIPMLRKKKPLALVAALPVASPAAVRRLAAVVDEVICPLVPEGFKSVGAYYADFTQVADETVEHLLAELFAHPKTRTMNREKETAPRDYLLKQLASVSRPLTDAKGLDPLIDAIGDSRYVLLGEASHGTHEYYTWRTHLTKRLIAEKGFSLIAVEGDWPDCYRLNRYVKGYMPAGIDAAGVLRTFDRWPTWMWANWEIVALAEWLRTHNADLPANRKTGFYGLDVYSLWESLEAVTDYLGKNDPAALETAKKAMECFEPYNVREGFSYASRSYGLSDSCEKAVGELLTGLRRKRNVYDGDHEAEFDAEQNALVAVNAERYYHLMLRGGAASWNIRDRHMTETLLRLTDFHGPDAKAIVWEHNTHIGDARATGMAAAGMVNIGQLLKEERGGEGVFRAGFGSYEGTVMAAYNWDAPMRVMTLPKARPGSWEHLLHRVGDTDQLLLLGELEDFRSPIGHRAVGVVYDPAREERNYVPSRMPSRYEAFLYFDRTAAVHPLHIRPHGSQVPETYPWGV